MGRRVLSVLEVTSRPVISDDLELVWQCAKWVLCAWAALPVVGCSQEQIVGYACPSGGCRDLPASPPVNGDCVTRIETPLVEVATSAELCWAYPLTKLGPPEQPIYLRRVELELTRFSHHVDLRLIEGDQLPSSIGPDGRDECGDAWTERQSEPLLATEDNSTPWDFSDAPLVTTPSHWLMINQHYVNRASQDDEGGVARVGVTVTLHCQRKQPPIVTQSFAYVRTELSDLVINVGQEATLCSSCNFPPNGLLRRMFRRTHQIDQFAVYLLEEPPKPPTPLWLGGFDTPCRTSLDHPRSCEFEEPISLGVTQPLLWTCTYRNDAIRSDSPIRVAAGTDACSLLGHYSVPAGDMAHGPERCARSTQANCPTIASP